MGPTLLYFAESVLQIMDRPCQFSEGARLDRVLAILKVSYRALCDAGLAREKFRGKLLGSCSDFF